MTSDSSRCQERETPRETVSTVSRSQSKPANLLDISSKAIKGGLGASKTPESQRDDRNAHPSKSRGRTTADLQGKNALWWPILCVPLRVLRVTLRNASSSSRGHYLYEDHLLLPGLTTPSSG